jgi:hypothetical protein
MDMGVDRGHKIDAQLADQGEIAAVLLEHRVNDQTFATGYVRQQVGEGAGVGIEELTEKQGATAGEGREGKGGRGSDGHG